MRRVVSFAKGRNPKEKNFYGGLNVDNPPLVVKTKNDKLKQRSRKFLFDKLRLPLLGFTHANWEIKRNPY
jgi:hypothetical protein